MYLVCIWYVFVCIANVLVHMCMYCPPVTPMGFAPVRILDWHVLVCICMYLACIGMYYACIKKVIQTNTVQYDFLGPLQYNTVTSKRYTDLIRREWIEMY